MIQRVVLRTGTPALRVTGPVMVGKSRIHHNATGMLLWYDEGKVVKWSPYLQCYSNIKYRQWRWGEGDRLCRTCWYLALLDSEEVGNERKAHAG